MNDYSEVTATLPREVTDLIQALNDHKWNEAFNRAMKIGVNMGSLSAWIVDKENGK